MAKRSGDAEEARVLTTYKGFNKDWKCRDFQYELGKTYEHDGSVVRCAGQGFHSCQHPQDIWNYYAPNTSRFAEVIAAGDVDYGSENDDSKLASAKITINVELSIGELTRRAVRFVAELAKKQGNGQHTTGNRGHASAAGNYGHAKVKGTSAVAHAPGPFGTAEAVEGSAISLAAYDTSVYPCKLVAVRSSMVGENGIEAGKSYRLTTAGEFEEVEE